MTGGAVRCDYRAPVTDAARLDAVGDKADRIDAQRFVGRDDALGEIALALEGRSDLRVFHLHGPGGVGKSAIARAAARAARANGHMTVVVDGRTIAPDPDGVAEAVAAAAAPRALLVIDEIDELRPLRFALRSAITEGMHHSSVALLVGRSRPDREWFDGGLEHVTKVLTVRPLDSDDAARLLACHGVRDPAVIDRVVRWCRGFPLALTVAASLQPIPGEDAATESAVLGEDGDLGEAILARLGGNELVGVDLDVLDVAAVAPAVDDRLLDAALPGRSTRSGLGQLRDLSTSEKVGSRVALHRLLRGALRARLRDTDPDRYRTLVLRVAEHLRVRALTEDPRVLLELADMVEDPALRLAMEGSSSYYADRVRAPDIELLSATFDPEQPWLRRLIRWCEDAPDVVIVVRRATGEAMGLMVACPSERLPRWAHDCIEIGPMIEWATAAGHLADSIFGHSIIFFDPLIGRSEFAEVVKVGNSAAFTRGLIRYHRIGYLTDVERRDDDGTDFLGYVEVPELRRVDGDRELLTWTRDFGSEGVIGTIADIIRMEQGALDLGPGSVGADLVAALRSFHDDDALRRTQLGSDPEAVRRVVRSAVERAFGDSPSERLLRDALVRTYLDADGGHACARQELHMSRSSFYRHLQRARQRLIDASA